ncbi:MAG: hypothetical protein ACJARI_003857 [Bacteroidia bacterium]|jgi:hypothetical protein
MSALRLAILFLVLASLISCSKFEDASIQPAYDYRSAVQPQERHVISRNPQKNLFFGDLHIHTSLSTDAFVFGVRSLPEDVYTFAKGGTIEHGAGYPIRISRPLDFVAVTDHAEYMGQARQAGLDIPTTQQPLRELLLKGSRFDITKAWLLSTNYIRNNGFGLGVDKVDTAINQAAWQMTVDAAERHNTPGAFTAFIAYEWSAFAGDSTIHIHRNVVYRGNKVSKLPFSYVDSPRPEDLWTFLEQENIAGRHVFAMPHNANLSGGNMYANRDSYGKPLTAEYADRRNRNEPISEILQVKGSSETHPLLSSLDEFAHFELTTLEIGGNEPELASVKGSYMRDALRVGMELAHSEGFNPFKFGVIGSSDSHNASSPTQENNYHGKLPMLDGSAGLRTDEATLLPRGLNPATRWGSGGLAAVWAEENTRASLHDALAIKETFATSGPRISVRFFGGWDYKNEILQTADFAQLAYAGGVPMGGQLDGIQRADQSSQQGPRFVVVAMKDPEGANLDRIQIIKAWVDSQGSSHETVFDVAVSDGRTLDSTTGKVSLVGNTVDLKTATYTNSIGAESLATLWSDPNFDPEQHAFYYARVIEIPTPRWSTFDAVKLGSTPIDPATIQERAITSAIWYAPSKLGK